MIWAQMLVSCDLCNMLCSLNRSKRNRIKLQMIGAAYVYSLGDDGNWGMQQKLLPTNSDSTANKFGNSVATSGNVIVVGADLDDSQGTDSGK